jgi:hypothetical protein
MTPRRIINRAVQAGLDIIAVSDHNSAANTAVAFGLAKDRGLTVLPAMEITSREEAHVLALFESVKQAGEMQEIVYGQIPDGDGDGQSLGYQLVVNEKDEIMEFCRKLFLVATAFSVGELVDVIHSLGGLAVASHIDRGSFSVLSQLGFIPEDARFDALEISGGMEADKALSMYGQYSSVPWISSSDAHNLDAIGTDFTGFMLEEASFPEIARAFRGERNIKWRCALI